MLVLVMKFNEVTHLMFKVAREMFKAWKSTFRYSVLHVRNKNFIVISRPCRRRIVLLHFQGAFSRATDHLFERRIFVSFSFPVCKMSSAYGNEIRG